MKTILPILIFLSTTVTMAYDMTPQMANESVSSCQDRIIGSYMNDYSEKLNKLHDLKVKQVYYDVLTSDSEKDAAAAQILDLERQLFANPKLSEADYRSMITLVKSVCK